MGPFVWVTWEPLHSLLLLTSIVPLFVGFPYGFLPLPIPRWTMPRWYRDGDYPALLPQQIRKERRAKKRREKERRAKQRAKELRGG